MRAVAVVATAVLAFGGATAASADPVDDGGAPVDDAPAADLGVECVLTDAGIDATWLPQVDAQDYQVTVADVTTDSGDSIVGVTATSYSATGLVPGHSYRLGVAARVADEIGGTDWCDDVVVDTVPLAPTDLVATAGDGAVALTWAAPVANGGSAVLGYELEVSAGGSVIASETVQGTSRTVTGLMNGTTYGFRVSATNAMGSGAPSATVPATPVGAPSAPVALSATPGNGSITVTWSKPQTTGGSAVTGYVLEYRSSGGSSTREALAGASATSQKISGLENGTTYEVRVSAVNAVGTSARSAAVSATPRTVSAAPTAVAATAGKGSITVTWKAPSSTSGGAARTAYVVEYSTTASFGRETDSVEVKPTATSFTITGLPAGARYYVRVVAVNAAGRSAASGTATTKTWAKPSAPRSVKVSPRKGAVVVTWSAPSSDGGAKRTAYSLRYSTDGSSWETVSVSASATRYTLTGLTNGQRYYVRVIAVNDVGNSPVSATVSATPRTVPSAPRSPKASPGKASIVVRWSAPSKSGGASRTAYVVQYRSVNGTTWKTASTRVKPSATSYTITGLRNGTKYYVRVLAVNAAGRSPVSSTVSATPRTTPSAPRVKAASAGSGKVKVSWSAPSSGGAAITGYVIQRYSGGTWRTVATVGASARSKTFSGLTNGVTYKFRVVAKNAAGTGSWSSSVSATPKAPKPASSCHPSYTGACVPIASDVDCYGGSGNGPAYVRGPVYVKGDDPYDLDSDGDGVGCES